MEIIRGQRVSGVNMRCKLSPYFSCKFCSECIVTFYDHDAVNASSLRSVVR